MIQEKVSDLIRTFAVYGLLTCLAVSVAWTQRANPATDDLKELFAESDVVVRGLIETSTGVIRPETANPQLDKGSSTLKLPNPKDYRVGTIYRVKVIEVIKGRDKSDEPAFLDIFVPGSFRKEGDPLLVEGQEFVLFLQTFKDKEGLYSNTELLEPDEGRSAFAPEYYYVITRKAAGVFDIEKDADVLQKIRSMTQ